ncbi:MAG TPA: molybdenum cofactor synthesis domain-containing protein [Candidatus Binatia bacterium]|nr:molybdenum cofactor synthesis domain-containing protein [Candidatus Binatia bacterium]
MAHAPHHCKDAQRVRCVAITVSDTRTADTDTSGARLRALLEEAGHAVVATGIVPDEPARIRARVKEHLSDPGTDAIITTGGTGLAPRDTTYEALTSLFEKRIDGFGELFRMLSFQDIGAAAMLSRAAAGVAHGKVLVLLPGSTAAVELAMTRLVLPQLGHMVALVRG